ncbi:hypothetical protein A1O3_06318 [Capronia epimyces CBS 606.96]|uniref:Uncharacterized protein n=1 Tax=Capronia epimyces CBS 606.96 TaxID=1182542 RepID=W9XYQ2_9EURO|nr:uncharacterized protein A1O3_06318 [Capronia epimyces CBS 606.96]EXJ82505.1 hypothetical protein A1O3_06318 [Capronia epimyces CBS 606.96]
MGSSFLDILHDPLTRKLLGFDAVHAEQTPFVGGVTSRLKFLLHDATNHLSFLKLGYTALEAFLQANVTGPPLDFDPEEALFPVTYRNESLPSLKEALFESLSVDGSRPYPLTPHIELFWLAKVILSNPTLADEGFNGRRARIRVNFWHQKLLSEPSPSLRDIIYSDADILERQLTSRVASHSAAAEEHFVEFLVERATIRTYYGDDALARTDLARAATTRRFQFAVTGVLGKRTKFQDRDISQLVVLAKSTGHEHDSEAPSTREPTNPTGGHEHSSAQPSKPENVPLNDDTLLEQIHFTSESTSTAPVSEEAMTHVVTSSSLPPQLASLDPSNQPLLSPIDSVILLATATSISNTSPDDGLLREETLPYATRVLEGGSSNWQVYTQALLVRSRIEGYRSRTTERGLLQLQALVDQVIAETSVSASPASTSEPPQSVPPSTFLPKPKASESASVAERLRYIYQLSPPLRWELEAELAARWTHMGGLKTALEIYERLQMQAEIALCLAATDREQEAIELLRGLLFEEPAKEEKASSSSIATLKLRSQSPADSPRLLCILGDITGLPSYYTLAWNVSSNRYARAQRSLGRHFTKKRDFNAAAEAYTLALGISRLDRASWFALGCIQLELQEYQGATESFTRCIQLEDQDGEAWSNLAVALLRLPKPVAETRGSESNGDGTDTTTGQPTADQTGVTGVAEDEEEQSDALLSRTSVDPYQHIREALRALRRAATLKRDDARIWDNYLTVAASIPPSAGTPWNEVVQALGRVIELRGKKEGENAVDLGILRVLTEYITREWVYPTSSLASEEADDQGHGAEPESKPETQPTSASAAPDSGPAKLPYLARSFLALIDTQVAPLATSSPPLYDLLCSISEWRARPSQALQYAEKAWRAHLTSVSAAETFDQVSASQWASVVDKTIWLIQRYRDLGPRERERTGGQVEPKWRFKAKSAARRVLGRGKQWEETDAWARLKNEMDALNE